MYWKVSACGVTTSEAGAAVTVSVTAIDTGVFVAPAAEICTVPLYVPALRPAGETDTERLDGAVPDAADRVNHGWLGGGRPGERARSAIGDLDGLRRGRRAARRAGELQACRTRRRWWTHRRSTTPTLSTPAMADTRSVTSPVTPAGSFAEIAAFPHEVIVRVCAEVLPAGVMVTWQPLHCPPKFAPFTVIVEPAVTARPGAVVESGVTKLIAAPSLQRAAAK